MAAERGGGACTGTSGSRRFSIVSRSANPTEELVTAATTCSAHSPHTPAEPFPVIDVGMALSPSTSVDDISNGSIRWHTLEVPPQVTVRVTGNELVANGRVLSFGPISLKALTASVSSATAHFDGSLPSSQTDVGSPLGIRESHNGQ